VSRFWKRFTIAFAALLVVVYAGLSYVAGGPRDVYGMVRYALPYMHRGTLRAGDNAPDVRLLALDGLTHFHIRERISGKPLVLIFGSYT
jgi:hypothetical protein